MEEGANENPTPHTAANKPATPHAHALNNKVTGAGRAGRGASRPPTGLLPSMYRTNRTPRGRPRALPERSGSNSQQGLRGRSLGTPTARPTAHAWAEEAQSDTGQRPPWPRRGSHASPDGRPPQHGWKTPALGGEPASAAWPLPACARARAPRKHGQRWHRSPRAGPATAGEGRAGRAGDGV